MSRTPAEEAQAKKGNVQVLRSGPITEVELAPPITAQMLAGNAPGMAGVQPGTIDRPAQISNLDIVAPVVADARDRNRATAPDELGKGVEIVFAVVTNDKPIPVYDKGSQNRVTLKAGKQVDSQHYDLLDLARQGVRMKKVEKHVDPNEIPDWIFNSN